MLRIRSTHVPMSVYRGPLAMAVTALGLSLAVAVPEASGQDAAEPARLELTSSSDAAKQHFWAGVTDALNVFPRGATRHFEMALQADPNLALATVLHGFTAPGLTGPERQAEIDRGVAGLASASTNELLVGVAFKAWSAGDAPTASRAFETASELMPGDPYVASYAAQLAGARGDQTDVVARWQAVADAFPELASPYNNIAYQEFGRGNEAAALASVKRYVELAPDHPNAADSHAELLQWAGRYPEALDEYRRTVELDPDFDQGYMGAAEVLVLVGELDAATGLIAQGIEHAPAPATRVAAIRAMANVHMLAGSRDDAMGQLEQAADEAAAASLDGAGAFTHEQMALTDAVLGDGRFIAEYLQEAAAIQGDQTPVYLGMAGLAYAAAEDPAMARDASRKLAETSEAPFWQSMSRSINALVLLQEDNPQAALDELQDTDPSDPVAQAVMADAYERLDRPMAAAVLRERVTGNRQINLANPFWAFAVAHVRAQ